MNPVNLSCQHHTDFGGRNPQYYFTAIQDTAWNGCTVYTPVRLDGDHPRPYGDQKMYKVADKREHNAITNYKLEKSCALTAACAIIPRSHDAVATTSPRLWRFYWDIWAWQRRSPAIPRRSHHAHGVVTTRLVRVSLLHGDLRAFLPRSGYLLPWWLTRHTAMKTTYTLMYELWNASFYSRLHMKSMVAIGA